MIRSARALAIGVALAGVVLVGPTPLSFDDPAPPPQPPNTEQPANPAPQQYLPPPHRRHIDGDPVVTR